MVKKMETKNTKLGIFKTPTLNLKAKGIYLQTNKIQVTCLNGPSEKGTLSCETQHGMERF